MQILKFSLSIETFRIARNSNMNNTANSNATVQTNYGLIKGVLTLSLLNNVFYSFNGVPYAKPPLGDLRFKVHYVGIN